MSRRSPRSTVRPAGPSAGLLAAYRAAIYRAAPGDRPPFDLRVGSPSAPLDALLEASERQVWAWLTAVNPGSRRLAARANFARLVQLDHALGELGLPVVPGEALDPAGIWPPEPSRLVLGLDPARARRLALRFGQHAYLAGEVGGAVRLESTSST